MFSTNLKRPLVAVAVTAGLLAVAGPAGATIPDEPNALTATTEKVGVRAAAHLNETSGQAEAHAPTGEDSRGNWPL